MTAVLTPTPAAVVRPVPWHRLGWVAWRRYRPVLAATVALTGVVALYLILRGHAMRDAYAAALACTPQASAACHFDWDSFHSSYADPGLVGAILVFVPAALGAFAGAPLLGRELETGTFRFAWTQGAGRMRWLMALLVPGFLGVATLGAVFGALVSWYEWPLVDGGYTQRMFANLFPITGAAVVGWALLAFAVGVLAGLLARRALPAVAATLALWTGLAFFMSTFRQEHYQAPLVTSHLRLATSDVQVHQWWTHGAVRVSNADLNQVLQAVGVHVNGGDIAVKPGAPDDPFQYLLQHGYTQWTSYQPDSRYWPFQWIEFGWLVALSLLLLAAAVWLVRRRGA